MPAKAGIQGHAPQRRVTDSWIPAFAGMTVEMVASLRPMGAAYGMRSAWGGRNLVV
jgi:hypothetical protein